MAELGLNEFFVFTLVLARLSGLVMTAPIYGARDVPPQIRAFVALALALVVMPGQSHVAVTLPESMPHYVVFIGAEVLIGVVLGLGVTVLLAGIQLAGQLVSQVSGMGLANIVNPTFDEEVSIFASLLNLLAVAVFVIVGGHRLVVSGLMETFAAIPPGQAGIPPELGEALNTVIAQTFVLATRAAAPVVAAQLLATSIMALISRTLPQLNILAVGFGINSLVTLGTLALSLGGIIWAFQEHFDPLWEAVLDAVLAQAL